MVLVYEPESSGRVREIFTWEIIEVATSMKSSGVVLRAFYLCGPQGM